MVWTQRARRARAGALVALAVLLVASPVAAEPSRPAAPAVGGPSVLLQWRDDAWGLLPIGAHPAGPVRVLVTDTSAAAVAPLARATATATPDVDVLALVTPAGLRRGVTAGRLATTLTRSLASSAQVQLVGVGAAGVVALDAAARLAAPPAQVTLLARDGAPDPWLVAPLVARLPLRGSAATFVDRYTGGRRPVALPGAGVSGVVEAALAGAVPLDWYAAAIADGAPGPAWSPITGGSRPAAHGWRRRGGALVPSGMRTPPAVEHRLAVTGGTGGLHPEGLVLDHGTARWQGGIETTRDDRALVLDARWLAGPTSRLTVALDGRRRLVTDGEGASGAARVVVPLAAVATGAHALTLTRTGSGTVVVGRLRLNGVPAARAAARAPGEGVHLALLVLLGVAIGLLVGGVVLAARRRRAVPMSEDGDAPST